MRYIATLLFAICLWSCQGSSIPAGDSLILYSIDGNDYPRNPNMSANEKFHGYPVLGKIAITEADKRQQLINALNDSINSSDGSVAACFIPRHGLRLTEGTDIVDYVICFQCHQIAIYTNGNQSSVRASDSGSDVFNKFLSEAGIKIAP